MLKFWFFWKIYSIFVKKRTFFAPSAFPCIFLALFGPNRHFGSKKGLKVAKKGVKKGQIWTPFLPFFCQSAQKRLNFSHFLEKVEDIEEPEK